MILPNKDILISNSLLGTGSLVLKKLGEPQTVSSLWEKTKLEPTISTFEKFVLTVDMLFILDLVSFKDGILSKTKND